MKRSRFKIASITIVGVAAILLNSCQKEDNTPPVITLNGPSTVYLSLNKKYADPGGSATDDHGGQVYVEESDYSLTNPNVNLAGTYIIHYYSDDAAGNVGRAMRTIIVSNDAKDIAGTYDVTDNITGNNPGTYHYTVTVTASNTVNNLLSISDFSGLGNDVKISAKVSGGALVFSPAWQQPSGMYASLSIDGKGTIGSGKINGMTYTIIYNLGSDQGVSTWTKQ